MKTKKIAYLILAHDDPIHLSRLVKSLDFNSDIYVHIDKKTDIEHFKKNNINCKFINSRFDISWADISMIDAQIELLREALKSKGEYTHLMFLSGSCYPIKSAVFISEIFNKNPEKEFINFIDMRKSPEKYLKQVTKKWFFRSFIKSDLSFLKFIDKVIRKLCTMSKLNNKWDNNIIPYFGSQWCALTSNCAEYVLNYHDKHSLFREMNKRTFSPDEHYIHTIVGNSIYLNASGGVQPFEGNGTWRMANLHVIDETLAKWFNLSDWDYVQESDRLFIRKVRTKDGTDLIDIIDKHILNSNS